MAWACWRRSASAGLNLPVIVQTAHGGIDNVVSAMRAARHDFVVKPAASNACKSACAMRSRPRRWKSETKLIRRSPQGPADFHGHSHPHAGMADVLRTAREGGHLEDSGVHRRRIRRRQGTVARAIHGTSERKAKPFVTVNCGAIPGNLVKSILFGHEKGAFTGATERHTGKFVEASGGTLFLDEVGELPLAAQVKLLRALQEGTVEPVGASKP